MNENVLGTRDLPGDTRHRTAERKVEAGFLFALACLITAGMLFALSFQRLRSNAVWLDHTHQVLSRLDRLLASATDAETAERGYVITGDEDYLVACTRAETALGETEQELRELTADNPQQQQRLRHLTDLLDNRLAALNAVDDARRSGGFAAAQALVRNGPGKGIHDQLQLEMEGMATAERALLHQRQQRTDRSTSATFLLGIGSSGFALSCVAWAAAISRRDLAERQRMEAEREALRGRLAAQLADMRRLDALSSKLLELRDATQVLDEVLSACVELQHADLGNIQLYDRETGSLRIVAQRGFSADFLERFRCVRADDHSVCGRALQRRARVVVEDVTQDAEFAPYLDTASQAGFRGVQSTPMFGRDGAVIGMLSTHFRNPHRPSDRDLQMTDLYTHTAAVQIERVQDMDAVRRARDEADHANQAKGRFLSTASHDLRQPLQTISLLNGTLRRLPASADAAQALEQQRQAIAGMSILIDALLDIGKLDSGVVKPEFTDFMLAPLFAELRTEFSGIAARKGLALEIPAPESATVSDRTLLGQILRNLLTNAIRYTQCGSVRLECASEGDKLRIDVADTGIGIAAGQLQHIFEEFYQAGVSPNGAREGHGLGLNIVKRTAQLLHHEIRVTSELGSGSVFSIVVPVGVATSAERNPEVALTAHGDAAGAASHVLLVEDDKAVLDATRLLLKIEGYRVTTGTCVSEAAERARDNPDIALLITDLHLGDGQQGTDVMRAVEQALGRRLKTVLITGDTSNTISQLIEDTSVRVARKPIQAEELLGLLAQMRENS